MNINRHNYEEYFILYMDNELGSAERHMVETFVQNNPDLKDELDILLQSKLDPDNTIVFESKEELMKPINGSTITLSNYEEWLTLYIDNELNHKEKGQVETFIISHPQVKDELAILQKAKLQPEEIIFPYKKSLYRQTEKVRIVQMRWWRVAAAAILLLAIGTTAVVLLNNNKKQTGRQTATNPVKNEQIIGKENPVSTNTKIKKETVEPGQKEQVPKQINKQESPKLANNNISVKNNLLENPISVKKEEQLITDNSLSNNLPQPINNPYLKSEMIKTEIEGNNSNIENTTLQTNNKPVTIQNNQSSLINKLASGKQDNPDSQFASLEDGGQNKKSRGFFRKAVRFLEKRTGIKTANDDDKVLIGALAVKLN